MLYFILFIILVIGAYITRQTFEKRAHKKLLSAPLWDTEWETILKNVPLCKRLPVELRPKLEGKINLFLDQVEFQGCNGLDVTPEMELSIAAQACVLVVNNDAWYQTLQTILIYPNAFKSRQASHDGYVVTQREVVRTGESWARGPVILSWAHAAQDAFIDDDGHNVVLHEFAHQLDALSGYTDGAPILSDAHSNDDWDRILNKSFNRLVSDVEKGHETTLDPYGATAPAEFFAVAVEMFFERPTELKHKEPAVYAQLSKLFVLDPDGWTEPE